jgi:hypothetical protein
LWDQPLCSEQAPASLLELWQRPQARSLPRHRTLHREPAKKRIVRQGVVRTFSDRSTVLLPDKVSRTFRKQMGEGACEWESPCEAPLVTGASAARFSYCRAHLVGLGIFESHRSAGGSTDFACSCANATLIQTVLDLLRLASDGPLQCLVERGFVFLVLSL